MRVSKGVKQPMYKKGPQTSGKWCHLLSLCMAFYLVHAKDGTYIANPDVNLKVDVYDLHRELFLPTPGHLDFYCHESGKAYAFEADPKRSPLEDVTAALLWFGAYIGLPEVNVLLNNPLSNAKN